MLSYLRINTVKNENLRQIASNVPQFGDFDKCSSGSRILRSQFFPGLPWQKRKQLEMNTTWIFNNCRFVLEQLKTISKMLMEDDLNGR